MSKELLSKLKELQKARGDVSAFANHDEFLPWADMMPPLLEFDENLHQKFNYWSKRVKFAYSMGRDHHEALGECIGVVNQAITKLEVYPQAKKIAEVGGQTIKYPDKVTLSWLYHNVPLSFWIWFIGLLIGVFSLGVGVSETEFYKSLKSSAAKSYKNL